MHILIITHPSAVKAKEECFRPLSEQGQKELKKASQGIMAYINKYNLNKIDGMLTSSATRCVNTAFELAQRLVKPIKLRFVTDLFE